MDVACHSDPTEVMRRRIQMVKSRKIWCAPTIDYTYCPWGASDISALHSVRVILAGIRTYFTSTTYRKAVSELRKIGKCEAVSEYVREAAKVASDYMDDYELLGTVNKGVYHHIQPQNAASLKLREWGSVGAGNELIVTTYNTAQKLLYDRYSIDLPPHVVYTNDKTLMGRVAYYRKYKYAILGAQAAEIERYGLTKQLSLAMTSVADMSPDDIKLIMNPERINVWLTAIFAE